MPVRSQHPVQLTAAQLTPQGVTPPPKGGARIQFRNGYSSFFAGGRNDSGTTGFVMDGEYLRSSLAARIGLGSGLELDVEVPVGFASGGFLDSFVIAWHDFWGFPDQGRSEAPRNRFLVEARNQGEQAWQLEDNQVQLLDLPIGASWNVIPLQGNGSFGMSLRGQVELPTGDPSTGFGSGGWDFVVGATGEIRADPVSVTMQAQYSWVSTPDQARSVGLEFADVWAIGAGVEWPLTDGLTAIVQSQYENSVLANLDAPNVGAPQWLIWTGVRAQLAERWQLEAAIGEDLSYRNAPDFTMWLMLEFQLGSLP